MQGVQRAIQRGQAGSDPIDENGVRMLRIQALAQRVRRLAEQIKRLRTQRGGA